MGGAAVSDYLRILDGDGDYLDINHGGMPPAPVGDGARLLLLRAVSRFHPDQGTIVAFNEDHVRELAAFIQAWIDAPRDAARAAAEVVAEQDGVRLLKTSLGEWGVDNGDGLSWFDDEATAKAAYVEEPERVICDGCEKTVTRDDATDHGDGYYCEACAEAAAEEFKASRWRCTSAECGWSGTGPEVAREDGDMSCPKCGEYVEEVIGGDQEPSDTPTREVTIEIGGVMVEIGGRR